MNRLNGGDINCLSQFDVTLKPIFASFPWVLLLEGVKFWLVKYCGGGEVAGRVFKTHASWFNSNRLHQPEIYHSYRVSEAAFATRFPRGNRRWPSKRLRWRWPFFVLAGEFFVGESLPNNLTHSSVESVRII
jgi:hypothetical protein